MDNLKDPEPYDDDGFIHEDELGSYDMETIHLDDIELYLTKFHIQFCLPINNYDVAYAYHLKQMFGGKSLHYNHITECDNHFFNTKPVSPFGLFDDFGGFDIFDHDYTANWVLNNKFKMLGLADFIKTHEFLTDSQGNKVWIPQELGCKQISTIKLALNLPNLSLDQMLGLDEVFTSCHGNVTINIATPEQALTISLVNNIPKITVYKNYNTTGRI